MLFVGETTQIKIFYFCINVYWTLYFTWGKEGQYWGLMRTEEIKLCETILNGILEIFGVKKENLGEGVYEGIIEALKNDLLTRKPEVVAKKTLELLGEKSILTQKQTEEALKTLEEEVEKQDKAKVDSGENMTETAQRMATSPKLMAAMMKLEPTSSNPRLVNQWFEEFEDRWTLSYTDEERGRPENGELKLVHLRILYGIKVRTFMDGKADELKDTYEKAKNWILKRFGSDAREEEIDKLVNFKIRVSDPEQFNEDTQKFRDLIEKAYGDVKEKELLNRLGGMLRGDLQTMFFTYLASINSYDDMVSKLIQYMNIKGPLKEKKFKNINRSTPMKKDVDKDDESSWMKKKCYQCGEMGHIKPICPLLKAKSDVKIERTSKASENDKDKRIEELTQMVNKLSRLVNEKEYSTNICRKLEVKEEKKLDDDKENAKVPEKRIRTRKGEDLAITRDATRRFKEFYVLGTLMKENKKHEITEVPVTCLIDTGSTRTIITESVYRAVTKKEACNLTPISFNLADGSTWSLMGVADVTLKLGQLKVKVKVAVCQDGDFNFERNQTRYSVMVGSDLLTATNACINYGTEEVTLEGLLVPSLVEIQNSEKNEIRNVFRITNEEKMFRSELEKEFPQAISKSKYDLGRCTIHAPKMEEIAQYPKVVRYKHSQENALAINEEIKKLCKVGVLKECMHPSIVLNLTVTVKKEFVEVQEENSQGAIEVKSVVKKDKRICLDARPYNKVAQRANVSVQPYKEVFQKLRLAKRYSTIDMRQFFYQMPLHESDREKLGVQDPITGIRYSYQCLPFGLINSPSYAQSIIEEIIKRTEFVNEEGKSINPKLYYVSSYLDDVLVSSMVDSDEFHKLIVRCFMRSLSNHNIKCNFAKTTLLSKKIVYLNFCLENGMVSPNEKYIKCLESFPRPETRLAVKRFLGMVSYVHGHLYNVAEYMAKIYKAIQQNKICWGEEQEEAFLMIKKSLRDVCHLHMGDPERDYVMFVDASKEGEAACIGQFLPIDVNTKLWMERESCPKKFRKYEVDFIKYKYKGDEEVRFMPLGFYSKRNKDLTPQSATKLELRCLDNALAYFKSMVNTGRQLIIYTDHKNVINLLSGGTDAQKYMRHINRILTYGKGLTVRYLEGKENCIADTLSRGFSRAVMTRKYLVDVNFNDMEVSVADKCERVDNQLESREKLIEAKFWDRKLSIPERKLCLFQELHDESGHTHTLAKEDELRKRIDVSNEIDYETIKSEFKKYVQACSICKERNDEPKVKWHLNSECFIATAPLQIVQADVLGPLPITERGNRYAIIWCDVVTRYLGGAPLSSLQTECILKGLEDSLYYVFGRIMYLKCDNAQYFISLKEILKERHGTQMILGIPYKHTSQGVVERSIKTVEQLASKMALELKLDSKVDWDNILAGVLFHINNAKHSTVKESPFYLLHGFRSPLKYDLNLKEESLEQLNMLVDRQSELEHKLNYKVAQMLIRQERDRCNKRDDVVSAEDLETEELEKPKAVKKKIPKKVRKLLPGTKVRVYFPKKDKFDATWKGGYVIKRRSRDGRTYEVSKGGKGRYLIRDINHLKLEEGGSEDGPLGYHTGSVRHSKDPDHYIILDQSDILRIQIITLLESRSLACDEGTISLVLENVPPKAFTSSCESRVINLISSTIDRLLEDQSPSSSDTSQGAEDEEISLLIDRFESSFKDTIFVTGPSTDMVANWEGQSEFDSAKNTKFSKWIDALELRFNLDDMNETTHAPRMLTILKLKVGPLGRETISDAQATTYALAKEALKERYDYKMSVEAAIMKLSMTRVDYTPDKFGESVRAIGDLICATIPNLPSSSKLDVVSQRLLSILKGSVQRRLLDRLGFYKSLNDLYTDLEFNNQMSNDFNNGRRPLQPRNQNLQSQLSRNDSIRCHHCNFPGHKKAQCKRFAKGLPKADYTVERKDRPDAPKTTCAVSTPSTTSLRPAVVMLPINGLPTKCLIDSGSAISLIHFNNAQFFASYGCDFKITGATGVEETIKSYSKLSVNVGTKTVTVHLYHSKSSVVLEKTILGMDFITQVSPTTITSEGIVLNNQLFKYAENLESTISAAVDMAREAFPVRSLCNMVQVNNTEIVPEASPLLSNEDVLAKITERYGDEGLYDVFSMDKTDIGQCCEHVPYIAFDYSKVKPFRPFNFPTRLMDQAELVIQEMIDSGTIEEAPAKLLHNLIPVKKRDNTIRPTTDMRRSNDAAPNFDYPVHRVDNAVQEAAGGDYYLLCDLVSSFHQFRLHPDNVGDIGIFFNRKTYRYLSLPQGFKLSPQLMQSILDSLAIPGLRWYYDDGILKTVGTLDDHLERVRNTLLMLKVANLKISWKKSILCSSTINYLGHTISKHGTQVSESACKAIMNLKTPTCASDVKSLLGSLSFYCSYVSNFANKMLPITALLKKDTPFVWSNECQRIFDDLKSGLCSRDILYTEIKDLPLEVYTDASQTGFGGYMAQTIDGTKRILRYWSKKRTHTIRQRDSVFLEGMSIILFARKHLHYLLGAKILWHSDNLPIIKYFSKNLDHHPQLSAWATELSVLDITWKYLPGPSNMLADTLSRLMVDENSNGVTSSDCTDFGEVDDNPSVDVAPILISKVGEENVSDIFKERLKEEQKKSTAQLDPNQILLNDIIYCKTRTRFGDKLLPLLPKSLYKETAQYLHEKLGHPGIQRTLNTLLDCFRAEGIRATVEEVVNNCNNCQVAKPSLLTCPRYEHVNIPSQPLTSLAGDIWQFKSKNESISLLNFIDVTSRMWFPIPITDEKSQTIGDAIITDLFCRYGIPRNIRFDRQSSLRSQGLLSLMKSFDVNVEFGTTQHHNGNTLIERSFRTLKQMLRSAYYDYSDKSPISEIEFISLAISQAPFTVFFMRDSGLVNYKPLLDIDNGTSFFSTTSVLNNWKRIAADSMDLRDKRNATLPNAENEVTTYAKDDLVLLQNPSPTNKLDTPFIGPFIVNSQKDAHLFIKSTDKLRGRPKKVHVSQVKRYIPDDLHDVQLL
uniref:RNA-directed DNA polymerase n=1 Tax=Strongyloides papillosus TaxID=174720 RepID=A0A0N5CFL9_STREA